MDAAVPRLREGWARIADGRVASALPALPTEAVAARQAAVDVRRKAAVIGPVPPAPYAAEVVASVAHRADAWAAPLNAEADEAPEHAYPPRRVVLSGPYATASPAALVEAGRAGEAIRPSLKGDGPGKPPPFRTGQIRLRTTA